MCTPCVASDAAGGVGRLSHRPSGQYPCWWLQAGAGVSCPGVGLQQQGHASEQDHPPSHVRIKRAYEAPMPGTARAS